MTMTGLIATPVAATPATATELSVDPRTLQVNDAMAVSTAEDLASVVAAAVGAASSCAAAGPDVRAGWLTAVADAVTADADELAAIADRETGLGRARLDGEVQRCADQLRFYASVCREGSWLGATIDHATATTPDLRRVEVPLGPVAVFGASNFPFGFGTLGNDTGAALAAGCPVVVKGHPAHPLTHTRLVEVAARALAEAGAPAGTFGAVTGFDAGRALVLADAVTAVAFTGSQSGGMALWALAQTRPNVIPVYAEMGTVNPVIVTPRAVADAEGAATLGRGAVASFTLGMGQFCTKPGLLLAPAGSGLATIVADALLAAAPRGPLLTGGIAGSYVTGIEALLGSGATLLAAVPDPGPGTAVCAVVLAAPADLLQPGSPLLAECFGPVILVVEYADAAELGAVVGRLHGALVGSVMTGGPDDPDAAPAVEMISRMAGRVAVDTWPTGVATTWAQQHGGPWPSTTVPAATSVGAAALGRFTRPVAYQSTPAGALPPALAEDNPWRVVRRVDGRLRTGRQRRGTP